VLTIHDLSRVEVGYLLHNLGFENYVNRFLERAVTGIDLALCTERDLEACGMDFR